jgi:hypothetical protein
MAQRKGFKLLRVSLAIVGVSTFRLPFDCLRLLAVVSSLWAGDRFAHWLFGPGQIASTYYSSILAAFGLVTYVVVTFPVHWVFFKLEDRLKVRLSRK